MENITERLNRISRRIKEKESKLQKRTYVPGGSDLNINIDKAIQESLIRERNKSFLKKYRGKT